ncbi:MAG: anhydro-N-acetylmuramic acid kinase [Balneolales bacterium]
MQKLADVASKKERIILGLMSGTSMDGLDMALCGISGSGRQTQLRVDEFVSVPYLGSTRTALLEITSVEEVDMETLCIWNTHLAHIHAAMIGEACLGWQVGPGDIDLIASHGHTVYHAPRRRHGQAGMPDSTLQIGDGDHIACKTGIITISDFRQKDTARGGEGAPLAACGDYLLFSHPQKDRVLVNLGGIANFTWLPSAPSAFPPLSMDSGPANTLIDQAMRKYYDGAGFDEGGTLALKGKVDRKVLAELKKHPYLHQDPPKTTGPEQFRLSRLEPAFQAAGAVTMNPEDRIATLTRYTVETLAEAILKVITDRAGTEIFVSGGGIHNVALMQWLSRELEGIPIKSTAALGLAPDAKEAALFAVLANEAVCGNGEQHGLGKISLP